MNQKIDVSVILCAYNEENVIEKAIARVDQVLAGANWSYEIIVVDDGSLDKTKEEATSYKYRNGKNNLQVVSYTRNLGKGNAFKEGFKHAKGEFIVLIDSDLDVDPEHIPRYVESLKNNDIAVASKWHPVSCTMMPWRRRFLSFGFNVLSRLLTGIKLRDTQAGLKAFRRTVLERILPRLSVKRFAFDLEIMAACNHCGFKIVEMPVSIRVNSIIKLKEIFRMAFDLVNVAYRLRILKFYQRSLMLDLVSQAGKRETNEPLQNLGF
ncbi:MAG: glycosyltransferase family 2 protein [Candidatus Bathyarchaeia archaeon]